MNPTLITSAELCEFLDQHPTVEAQAMLSVNLSDEYHVLEPGEVGVCRRVLQGDPVACAAFPAVRDRVMLRWATARRAPTAAAPSCEGRTAAAVASDKGPFSPPEPAGEASRLPAGPLGRVEWTFTRFPDGRIILEQGQ